MTVIVSASTMIWFLFWIGLLFFVLWFLVFLIEDTFPPRRIPMPAPAPLPESILEQKRNEKRMAEEMYERANRVPTEEERIKTERWFETVEDWRIRNGKDRY